MDGDNLVFGEVRLAQQGSRFSEEALTCQPALRFGGRPEGVPLGHFDGTGIHAAMPFY